MVREASQGGAGDRRKKSTGVADAGRFHNQDPHSPESIAQSVESLEAAIRSLEARVATMSVELHYQIQGVEHRGEQATRSLALDVLAMGESLSRRIRAQPAPAAAPPPAPRAAGRISPTVAGLAVALAAAVSALGWTLFHPSGAGQPAKPTTSVAAALYDPAPESPASDAAASNLAGPAAAMSPVHPAPRHHWRPKVAVHHLARAATEAGPAPAPLPDTLPGSGGHSILGPSPG